MLSISFESRNNPFEMLSLFMSGPMPVRPPSLQCNTTFVGVFIQNRTIQLQWNPVKRIAPECPDTAKYNVSYRCCSSSSWQHTRCTPSTSIEIKLDGECESENLAAFLLQIEGSNYLSHLIVNLKNDTGMKLSPLKHLH